MNTNRITALTIALLAACTIAAFGQEAMTKAPPASGSSSMMMAPKEAGAMGPADTMQPEGAMSAAYRIPYISLDAARMLAEKSPVVLFFAADWCPTCRAALKDIDANGSRLGDIKVVVVDFDKYRDLKARYGIVSQHSYVQIDSAGNKVAIWNGGGVDGILKHVTPTM